MLNYKWKEVTKKINAENGNTYAVFDASCEGIDVRVFVRLTKLSENNHSFRVASYNLFIKASSLTKTTENWINYDADELIKVNLNANDVLPTLIRTTTFVKEIPEIIDYNFGTLAY